VTLEFKFRVSTALPVGGIVEIYFPAGFSHDTKSLFPYVETITNSYGAGQDVEVVVSDVNMP